MTHQPQRLFGELAYRAGSWDRARRVIVNGRDGQLAVYQLYWIDGRVTASDWVAKFLSTSSPAQKTARLT